MQYPGQSFFTGIEKKLVNQILFVSDVPCQQICHEHIRKRMFLVRHFHHVLLFDSHHSAIGHCGCGAQADRLSGEATFSEEIALVQNAYGGFLPAIMAMPYQLLARSSRLHPTSEGLGLEHSYRGTLTSHHL